MVDGDRCMHSKFCTYILLNMIEVYIVMVDSEAGLYETSILLNGAKSLPP